MERAKAAPTKSTGRNKLLKKGLSCMENHERLIADATGQLNSSNFVAGSYFEQLIGVCPK